MNNNIIQIILRGIFGIKIKIIMLILMTIITYHKNNNKKLNYYRVEKTWSKMLVKPKLYVKGKDNIPKNNGYIVLSNHISVDDTIILNLIFKNIHYVSNYENTAKIFLNDYPNLIFYNKSNDIIKAGQNVKDMILELTNNNKNVLVFPEGKYSLENELQPFKKGLFYLSWDNKITFLPVLLLVKKPSKFVYTHTIVSDKIMVRIYEPINPINFNSFDEYYQYIYNLMNNEYKNYIQSKEEYDVYF